jgi:uncharacterized membrane-anchored protein
LGPEPTPLRDRNFTIEHGLLKLATLSVIAYKAAAHASLRLKQLDAIRVYAAMSAPAARQARMSLEAVEDGLADVKNQQSQVLDQQQQLLDAVTALARHVVRSPLARNF